VFEVGNFGSRFAICVFFSCPFPALPFYLFCLPAPFLSLIVLTHAHAVSEHHR
jgi:hypothetical protein